MRFYVLSDNRETLVGMRLAGIEGELVQTEAAYCQRLDELCEDKEIGVILVTGNAIELSPQFTAEKKLHCKRPLIAEIGDRHSSENISEALSKYVKDAVGISIE